MPTNFLPQPEWGLPTVADGQGAVGTFRPRGAVLGLEGLRRAACGAGPMLGIGPAITDHISSNDRDAL